MVTNHITIPKIVKTSFGEVRTLPPGVFGHQKTTYFLSSSVLGAYAPSGFFCHRKMTYFFEICDQALFQVRTLPPGVFGHQKTTYFVIKLCFRCVRSLRGFWSPKNDIFCYQALFQVRTLPPGVFGHQKTTYFLK